MFVNRKNSDRRVPTQERSRQRVERILESAAHVFASQGYEAATMEAIAAGAETSIGSIYQFYPNKRAVFRGLLERYHDSLKTWFDALLDSPLLELPWRELLDSSIDAVARFHETEPGFRAVWVGMHLTEEVLTEGEAMNRELARRIESVLGRKLDLPAKQRPIVATMIVEIVTMMLILSARRPTDSRAVVIETKALLRRYLAPFEKRSAVRSKRRLP
jgi:AcrR family transcriptional regulator